MNSLIYGLITLQLALVAWRDIKTQKISNFWSLGNAAVGIGLYLFLPQLYPLSWRVLVAPTCSLFLGFVLFQLRIMGAGDSKFLASLFLLIPLSQHLIFFEQLLLSTIAVGMILVGFKVYQNFTKVRALTLATHWAGVLSTIRGTNSFAPVILLSWILLGMKQWK